MKQATHHFRPVSLISAAILFAFNTFVLSTSAYAQNPQRQVLQVKQSPAHLVIVTNDGEYQIRPYSTEVVETQFIPKGEVISAFDQQSHAVVAKPQVVKMQLQEAAQQIDYASAGISVRIQKAPFQISYFYQGKLLTSEKMGYEKIDNVEKNKERLSFHLDANEALYGAGARALGMNRRGHRLPLYNKAHYGYEEQSSQMNFAIPLVYSSKMYGIHFDNAAIGTLDLDSNKDNSLSYETIGGRKIYQIIAGASWAKLIANYTQLTGRQPLPPRWAFGNFASRFGYHSEAEARQVIAQYRAEQIPVDAIIFDLYWFGKEVKGTMGNLAFDQDNFKNPKSMIADFNQQGVKTVLITEPFILTTSNRWQEAVQEKILATDHAGKPFTYDFYFGNTGLIDLFQPKARDWFWNIYKGLAQQGVAGVWGDLGEPEVHPSELRHANGQLGADQVHNIYGHEWAKLIAQGYQKDFPTQRPFILMRAGYSGSQRFGLIPWSGDVNRTWGGLRSQPEIALQMGMQGLAYMHSDLGGFAGANLDDELYARWLQYGVFQPIFRPHAQEEVASEPIFRAAKAKQLAKAAIELRYRLLPYNYTLAFENQQLGLPLMRPLFFAEPDKEQLRSHSASYLWGNDFLVQPIMQAGQQQADVMFPQGTWIDFYSGQVYNGGTQHTVEVHQEHIPVFVRAGAFIPMAKPMQSTQFYDESALELHYYHDAAVSSAQGSMYEDDGITAQSYQQGRYRLHQFTSALQTQSNGKPSLQIQIQQRNGKKMKVVSKQVSLFLHNVEQAPNHVLVNGKKAVFSWNPKSKLLTAQVRANAKSTNLIRVNW
ncbi:glycoside hydrolase family 31 protein [Undibacterium macrobrachii]|jgi:alpha-glucosidase (family GH31 glycosyl hydrolase)|uniref:Alpha-glucosidase n=1 Tax=Undibacterium macrobrachii TaxID=1119058 RepID=A0ABQ2X9T9_9BURK|nr:TIM-barrel domain-containing protein [Undibacterium macrobrachii]GGX06736.1 alpha-glucosidase [Undibacterium macrobrachii]